MIKIKETKYECNICGEKKHIKEVCIYRNTGDNIICIRLCPHCMQRMATELMIAPIGEDAVKSITDCKKREMVGHSGSIIEQYYHE